MKIGDAEIERGNGGVYEYEVWFRVRHLVTSTETLTWNTDEEFSKEAIEGEYREAEVDRREPDGSDDEIEYVHVRVTREEEDIVEEEFEVDDGSARSDFDQARIKTILRENGIQPEDVTSISGYVEESTVFLHG